MQTNVKKDITILLGISFLSAILYIAFEGTLMEFGRNEDNCLWLRFLPVLLIQMGMSCVGPFIIFWKNKEALSMHGIVRKKCWSIHTWLSARFNSNDRLSVRYQ